MCHHIKPTSVKSYLSGICNQLETFYPSIREIRTHKIVTKTLTGCTKLRASATSRKRPLTREELITVQLKFTQPSHDDNLFLAILFTSFHGLMRLGENTWPDKRALQDYRKVIMRSTVTSSDRSFGFLLPSHKADRLFEGNHILIHATNAGDDPVHIFSTYLHSRDLLFPMNPELWFRSDGSIPTRRWFMQRLTLLFPDNVGGHSLRAGGATSYALAGIPPHLIQAMGRWSSDAFQIYIRQHPALLASLL
jgi:hypothetical protein